MKNVHSLDLPRRLQVEFSRLVQRHTDRVGGEIDADTLWRIFEDAYLPAHPSSGLESWGRFVLGRTSVSAENDKTHLKAELFDEGEPIDIDAVGNGPIDAFTTALRDLGMQITVRDYAEHALSSGQEAKAASYIEAEIDGMVVWGVGIDPSIGRATYNALLSALNRALR